MRENRSLSVQQMSHSSFATYQFNSTHNQLNQRSFSIKSGIKIPRIHKSEPYGKSRSVSQWSFMTEVHSKPINMRQRVIAEDNLKVQVKLNKDNQFKPLDQDDKIAVGSTAVNKFYQHYKNIQKVEDQNQFTFTKDSLYTLLLRDTSLKQLPLRLGFIKPYGEEDTIDISGHNYGDKYINTLGKTSSLPQIKSYNIAKNRITQEGNIILDNINEYVRELNMSSNRIGFSSCIKLSNLLKLNNYKLQVINVSDNKLMDKAVYELLKNLPYNIHLRSLNISRNQCTDNIAEILNEILVDNSTLQELYAKWNLFGAETSKAIFTALLENTTLKVLDLSHNNLGKMKIQEQNMGKTSLRLIKERDSQTKPAQLQSLLDFFEQNKDLIHLDLSNNHYSLQDCSFISEALNKNHSLYGFHFDNNYGNVDFFQFIQQQDIVQLKGVDFDIKGVEEVSSKNLNNCWICNGWKEVNFQWDPAQSPKEEGLVFLHIDVEDYEGYFMGNSSEGLLVCSRVLPHKDIRYFFTVNNKYELQADQPKKNLLKRLNRQIKIHKKMVDIEDLRLAHFNGKRKCENIFNEFYCLKIKTQPRIKNVPPEIEEIRVRPPWKFRNSVFKDYRQDNDDYDQKCFEEDWKHTRIEKLVKDQTQISELKEYLRTIYPKLKDMYRVYAGKEPIGDVWAISSFFWNQMIDETQVIDGQDIVDADVHIKLTATLSNQDFKNNKNNPLLGLVRCQFLEVFFRIAEEKYIKKRKMTTNYAEACKQCWLDHFSKLQIDSLNLWRYNVYWCEEVDIVFKSYAKISEDIYRQFSVRKVRPGQKPYMCLEELIDIFKLADLTGENLNEKDISVAASTAMMTQIDELYNERVFQIQYVEFLEILGRVAYKLPFQDINLEQQLSVQEQLKSPLYLKVEALMHLFKDKVVSPAVKKNFHAPQPPLFVNGLLNIAFY